MQKLAKIAGLSLFPIACLALYGGPAWDLFRGIAFGWILYLIRTLPKVKVSWDGVATGVVCLLVFAIGLHRTLRWLHGGLQDAGAAGGRRPWSIRWTASIVILVFAMFAVGVFTTGIAHQAGWLIAQRRSLVEEKAPIETGQETSLNNLKEISFGVVNRKSFENGWPETHPDRRAYQSWLTEILPFTHYDLGDGLHPDLPWNDPRNSAIFKGVVPEYLNPEVPAIRSAEGYALAHYAGNVHVFGPGSRRVEPGDFANTILGGEVAEGFKPWGDPTNLRDPGLGLGQVPGGFRGPSGSGTHFAFLDGSVRFFRETTSPDVLRRLSLPKPAGR